MANFAPRKVLFIASEVPNPNPNQNQNPDPDPPDPNLETRHLFELILNSVEATHHEHSSKPNPNVSRENRSTEIVEKMCFFVAFVRSKRENTANYRLPKLSLSLQTGHRTSLRHEKVTLVVSKLGAV